MNLYPLIVVAHVLAVIAAFAAHGVSAYSMFAVRRETDRTRMGAYLDLSSRSLSFASIALILVLALGMAASARPVDAGGGARLAPEIVLSDGINGVTAQTTLASLRGKPVLLVFWIPICPHCQKFMPEVDRLHRKYTEKGLKILTITHGKKDYTRSFMEKKKWTFGTGFDWTGVTAKRYGMKRMPGVYLVGTDGHLRSYSGSLEDAIVEELEAAKKTN